MVLKQKWYLAMPKATAETEHATRTCWAGARDSATHYIGEVSNQGSAPSEEQWREG